MKSQQTIFDDFIPDGDPRDPDAWRFVENCRTKEDLALHIGSLAADRDKWKAKAEKAGKAEMALACEWLEGQPSLEKLAAKFNDLDRENRRLKDRNRMLEVQDRARSQMAEQQAMQQAAMGGAWRPLEANEVEFVNPLGQAMGNIGLAPQALGGQFITTARDIASDPSGSDVKSRRATGGDPSQFNAEMYNTPTGPFWSGPNWLSPMKKGDA